MLPLGHQALTRLKEAMQTNQEYADSWHDNIACCIVDTSTTNHSSANKIASRIMKQLFGVETKIPSDRIKSKITTSTVSDYFVSYCTWCSRPVLWKKRKN